MNTKTLFFLLFALPVLGQQNIYLDQIGYALNATKYVYCDFPADSFLLIRQHNREVVLTAPFVLRKTNDSASGLAIYEGDFSTINDSGTYVIQVFSPLNPGITSYPFKIMNDVYNRLTQEAFRTFYFQRCGMPLAEDWAGPFHHKACHSQDAFHHPTTGEEGQRDLTGGWHDAGDYGKYTAPGAVSCAVMLMASELSPESFSSDNLGIPESGNGIPDLLDEVRYELEWLMKMQRPDGAVYEKVHSKDYAPFVMPDRALQKRYVYEVSSTATGAFTAIMAKASRAFLPYDIEFSNNCLAKALTSAGYLQMHQEIFPQGGFKNPADSKAGGYADDHDADERLWAAAEMYLSTRQEIYHQQFLEHYNQGKKMITEVSWANTQPLALLGYLLSELPSRDGHALATIKDSLSLYAHTALTIAGADGFRIALRPDEYVWGSNGVIMSKAINLLVAKKILNNTAWGELALQQLHSILGVNAKKMCYVSGMGTYSPIHIHHAPSIADLLAEPIPGFMVGGPSGKLEDEALRRSFKRHTPPAMCYLDNVESYASNEVAIYWNAYLLFVAGLVDKD